jgi:methionine synthase II (cobalamin-independent)
MWPYDPSMTGLQATGIGSWPLMTIDDAVRQATELWDLPYLPELPARGPGAEMVGRALGLLEIGMERGPSRWRVAPTYGQEQRRAKAMLRDDLDVLAEVLDGYEGRVKVSLAGPYTLLATVDLARGEPMVLDAGARRDLVEAHRAAAEGLVARLRSLVPGAAPVLQLDEPALGGVADGAIPTSSGLRRCPPVDAEEYGRAYRELASLEGAAGGLVVHSCAPAPWRTLRDAGVRAFAVDADLPGDVDVLAEHVDGGGELWLGIVPTSGGATVPTVDRVVTRTLDWLRPLELGSRLDGHLTLTPACGLASATPAAALQVAKVLREAAGLVAERLFG